MTLGEVLHVNAAKTVPVVVPLAGDKRVTSVATGEELELSDLGSS